MARTRMVYMGDVRHVTVIEGETGIFIDADGIENTYQKQEGEWPVSGTAKKIVDAIADVNQFERWIGVQPERIVGQTIDVNDCPITNYLQEVVGNDVFIQVCHLWVHAIAPSHGLDAEEISMIVHSSALASWYGRFIELADNRFPETSTITASVALELLEEAKR